MIKHGNPPYLECSSRGDRRFSAFYAIVNGESIEEQYQKAKVFEDGSSGLSWREAKGRKAVNQEEVAKLYSELWDRYIQENPILQEILRTSSGVSDIFGQKEHCCQATELWRIRQTLQIRWAEKVGETTDDGTNTWINVGRKDNPCGEEYDSRNASRNLPAADRDSEP